MNTPTLLAKSANYGEVPLVDHLRAVGEAARHFASHFGLDPALAYRGGVLHDIGKAHPYFQEVHLGQREPNPHETRKYGERPPFRHELSSLLFLPLFPEKEWPVLTEIIVAHHKSISGDPKSRGLLDLADHERNYKELHLGEWSAWMPAALGVLEQLELPTREIDEKEAKQALEWAEDYCHDLGNGWSEWRGLLMAADHFVSALEKLGDARRELPPFQTPDTSAFVREHRLFPLSLRRADQAEPHTLLVAPTGAGKTDYLLRRCRGRIFYVLPFQASINAMYERLKEAMPNDDVRLQHGASKLVDLEDANDQQQSKNGQLAATLQALVGANAKVLTPFQLSSIIFASFGFEAQILDLRGCDVILDEIHTYSENAQAIVFALVRELLRHDCRVHIGTATMPSSLYDRLKTELAAQGGVAEVALTTEELTTYNRHIVHKTATDDWPAVLDEALRANEKVLLVFNTVKGAQEAFQQAQEAHPGVPAMLIHSRFRRKDRKRLEQELRDNYDTGEGPCIVVSTQVVEVSLDISFDRMITEAAPLDALIQRFGRVNRRRQEETLGKLRPVHVLEPADKTLPYTKAVVQTSYERLPDGETLEATALQALLDEVYPSLDVQPIDAHLAWRENGRFKRRKLTHVSDPILLQLLEIDQETCILAEDETAYREGNWMERAWLEIPVNGKSLRPYRQYYPCLEGVGNEPYLITDQPGYERLGLVLKEPDNFI